jgi:hypothetical protein
MLEMTGEPLKINFEFVLSVSKTNHLNTALECEVSRNSELSVYSGYLVSTHLLMISLTMPL